MNSIIKTDFEDLPFDVTNIILSYLPPNVRINILRKKYDMIRKIAEKNISVTEMIVLVNQCQCLLMTCLNNNVEINIYRGHLDYYKIYDHFEEDDKEFIIWTGKKILTHIVTKYTKMYKNKSLKDKYSDFERVVFNVYSKILLTC